jgi:hypothetical protein
MNCKRFNDWIKDAVSGTLDRNREATLKTHLSNCSGCRQMFANEQRLFGAINRALTECFDREPAPDFAARVRIRLGEEREACRMRAQSVSGIWIPVGGMGISLLAVFLLAAWWLNRPALFRQIPLTVSPTTCAVTPTLNNGRKRVVQAPIDAAHIPGSRPIGWMVHLNNHKTTVPETSALDTKVLVHPGQWAAIVHLSRAATSEPAFSGSPVLGTVKVQEPVEIKGIEIKPVNVESVRIEQVMVREVVIHGDF